VSTHDHPPEGACAPACPLWSEGALELFALQRRHADMLAACRAAVQVECVIVAPETPGAELPDFLAAQELVRLNLVVGRDCPEVMLDEWGIRCNLTFRGRRTDCAIPWTAVKGGLLRAPPQPRKRKFGVVDGGAGAEAPAEEPAPFAAPAPATAATAPEPPQEPPQPPTRTPLPRPFGVIRGGREG
jgi:hypothetical protein